MKFDYRYENLSHWLLRTGKPRPCGYNHRHTIQKVREEQGRPVYKVSYYIPGYGLDREREYKTLEAAKAAITRYDNRQ